MKFWSYHQSFIRCYWSPSFLPVCSPSLSFCLLTRVWEFDSCREESFRSRMGLRGEKGGKTSVNGVEG
ncbi:hypothetical protein SLE2022_292290 [Rubroshorea leprosula]